MSRERPAETSVGGRLLSTQKLVEIQQQLREGITPTQGIPPILKDSRAAAEARKEAEAAAASAAAQANIPTPPRRASFIGNGTQGLNVSNFRVGGPVAAPNPATGRSRRTGPTLLGG